MASASFCTKARALANASHTVSISRTSAAEVASQQPRSTATTAPETPSQADATRAAVLRRRRHMPSCPQPQPTPNTTRFLISTRSEYFGQTEIERQFHGALTCLHRILGDVPYGRTQGVVGRTPIQMLSKTDASGRGSLLAFKVFNANGELRERIERELRAVEGVDGVRCEEGGSAEGRI